MTACRSTPFRSDEQSTLCLLDAAFRPTAIEAASSRVRVSSALSRRGEGRRDEQSGKRWSIASPSQLGLTLVPPRGAKGTRLLGHGGTGCGTMWL